MEHALNVSVNAFLAITETRVSDRLPRTRLVD